MVPALPPSGTTPVGGTTPPQKQTLTIPLDGIPADFIEIIIEAEISETPVVSDLNVKACVHIEGKRFDFGVI